MNETFLHKSFINLYGSVCLDSFIFKLSVYEARICDINIFFDLDLLQHCRAVKVLLYSRHWIGFGTFE